MMEIFTTSEFLRRINNTEISNKEISKSTGEPKKLTAKNSEVVSRSFWDFTTRPDIITFVVEDKELHVHKDLLVKSSPVFQVMIESESFMEKQKNKIELPNKKIAEMQEMLNLLYPFDHEITGKTNMESLLILSTEYQIKQIRDMCEKFLMEKDCSIHMLIVAQNYDLKDLLKKCVDYFGGKPLFKMEDSPRYSEVNSDNCVTIKLNQLDALRNNFDALKVKRSNSSINGYRCTCQSCQLIDESNNKLKC